MSGLTNAVRAEVHKLLALPTAWPGLVLGTLLSPLIVLVNAPYTRRAIAEGTFTDVADLGFQNLGIGLVGPTVLGVVVMSSEYTSTGPDSPGARQLTTTLAAVPDRLRLLAGKALALVLVVGVQAVVVTAAVLGLVAALHGEHVPAPGPGRIAGAVLYWVLTALLAFAVTVLARTGIVPLTLLIVNSTVVSLSYLLTKVTDLAAYLPDIAGARMFVRGGDYPGDLSPVTAGVVMTLWVSALLATGAVLFRRRNA